MLSLVSHRGESGTPEATKMEIFVSTTDDSQAIAVFIKNFALDATSVLDRVIDFKSDFK